MKKVLLITILFGASLNEVPAASYYTTGAGFWIENIWSTVPGSLPTLNDGDVLYINHNVAINSNLDISADITIIINATLAFSDSGSKIRVGVGSVFQLTSTGRIEGVSNSNQISIGPGTHEWSPKGNPIVGPGSFSDGWECPPCILPIKLLLFRTEITNGIVFLTWATTMEEDFSNFVIQRSSDGLTFEDLGEIPGKGFNIYDIETKYSFKDGEPMQGFNYYRLKAVDLDDSFEYFGVKAVNISAPRKMTIYPNPASGSEISFRTNFSPQESDRVIVNDQLGNEVYNSSVASSTNTLVFKNELRPGMYVLRYISKNFEQVSRVVIKN